MITWIFVIAIAIMLIWGCFQIRKIGNGNPFTTVVTNLGMLGTFLGIYIGLRNFKVGDVDEINASIPELLEGMKIAFITSIVGIGAYIFLRFVQRYVRPKDGTHGESTAETMINLLKITADNGNKSYDLIKNVEKSISGDGETTLLTQIQKLRTMTSDNLNELTKATVDSGAKNYDLIKNIEKSISGDGETTLLTQIQKLRTTTSDNLNELNKSFKEFAEKQADNNSKALIEALEAVMRDFNAKINEQFGDNFKRLNEAVGRMLEWQDNYKGQVEKMTEQFGLALKGITEARDVVVKLSKEASVYQETSVKLEKILDNLNTNLAGIDEMAKNAKDTFPIIQRNIETLTNEFSKSVYQAIADIKITIESSSKENNRMLDAQRDGINKQIDVLTQSYQNFEKQNAQLVSQINHDIQQLSERNAKTITEHFSTFDKQLQDELNNVMKQLGQNLASISNKFVQDYGMIADTILRLESALLER
jgi:hemoglobin-like flavoprotein